MKKILFLLIISISGYSQLTYGKVVKAISDIQKQINEQVEPITEE